MTRKAMLTSVYTGMLSSFAKRRARPRQLALEPLVSALL
jgi:hypothetical protein